MNRKQIILYYRTNRLLKGHKPAIVFLKKNFGKIYQEGQADFIMTMSKDALNFQRLSLFTKKLIPAKDFSLSISRLKAYNFSQVNYVTNRLTLYTVEKFFIEIYFNTKTADTYETENNIADIIKKLEEYNIKEIKLGEENE